MTARRPPRKPGDGDRGGRWEQPLTVAEVVYWAALEADRTRREARDRLHAGRMYQGQCVDCYGWTDDPRHVRVVAVQPLSGSSRG